MEALLNAIDKYAKVLEEVYVDPVVFIHFTLIVLSISFIRLGILFKYEELRKRKGFNKEDKVYITGHIIYEALISFVVTYFVIKITGAQINSYIINYITAPAIGTLAGVIIDNKIIIPNESLIKKKENKSNGKNDGIIININNSTQEKRSISEIANCLKADDENFNDSVIEIINDIKQTQDEHSDVISSHSDKLNNIEETLDSMKKSEIMSKKLELKELIYGCLNKNYATPFENDKITVLYEAYSSLGGNGEIETLYNDHYLKLDIHNDGKYHSNYGIYDD